MESSEGKAKSPAIISHPEATKKLSFSSNDIHNNAKFQFDQILLYSEPHQLLIPVPIKSIYEGESLTPSEIQKSSVVIEVNENGEISKLQPSTSESQIKSFQFLQDVSTQTRYLKISGYFPAAANEYRALELHKEKSLERECSDIFEDMKLTNTKIRGLLRDSTSMLQSSVAPPTYLTNNFDNVGSIQRPQSGNDPVLSTSLDHDQLHLMDKLKRQALQESPSYSGTGLAHPRPQHIDSPLNTAWGAPPSTSRPLVSPFRAKTASPSDFIRGSSDVAKQLFSDQ